MGNATAFHSSAKIQKTIVPALFESVMTPLAHSSRHIHGLLGWLTFPASVFATNLLAYQPPAMIPMPTTVKTPPREWKSEDHETAEGDPRLRNRAGLHALMVLAGGRSRMSLLEPLAGFE